MSDETKRPGEREYTVDEILAEYGSKGQMVKTEPAKGERPKKVVDFPTEKLPVLPPDEEDTPQPPARTAATAITPWWLLVRLMPSSLRRSASVTTMPVPRAVEAMWPRVASVSPRAM